MQIDELRTFVEVAEAGGLTAASARLGVSKSIVSRRLARLETELGAQLLARSTRGSGLTEAGITFREYATRICAEIDLAQEIILSKGDLRGRLRIAAPLTFGPTHFAAMIAELARRNPKLEVITRYSDRFVNLIAEGFDCAIRIGHLDDSSLLARRVGWTPVMFVAAPEYIARHGAPETPEDLLSHNALLNGTKYWHAMDGDQPITLRAQGRFKVDSAAALVSAATAALGVASLPRELIHEHLKTGALVPILRRYSPLDLGIWVVRPPGQHPAHKVNSLSELLAEYCSSLCRAIQVRDAMHHV